MKKRKIKIVWTCGHCHKNHKYKFTAFLHGWLINIKKEFHET